MAEKLSLKELPVGWELTPEQKLQRVFKLQDFKQAIRFVNQVADVAESDSHHPDILINYNRVTLTLWTHSTGGLLDKDFSLAQKINALN